MSEPFSLLFGMFGGGVARILLIGTVISMVFNGVQFVKGRWDNATIQSLEKRIEQLKTDNVMLQSNVESIDRHCQEVIKYYDNLPPRFKIDGNIDNDDVDRWLRGKTAEPTAGSRKDSDTKPATRNAN